MTHFFLRFGRAIVISRRHKRVRNGLIFFFRHFFLVVSALFVMELLVILLGVGNIFLPVPRHVWESVSKLVF
jgi:hypothetical protein